jgi:transposase
LPAPERLVLEGVEQTETGIIVRVRGKTTPQCPACSSCRVSYHSHYQRELRDLPWQGQPVRLHLRLRRFRCRNRQCERKIFAERLPGVVAAKARETECYMGLRPTNMDENRLGPTLYYESGVER